MRRFTSLKQVPAETRRILRDRLARYLPAPAVTSRRMGEGGVALSDESLLDLLLSLTIKPVSDPKNARAVYEAARPPGSSEPTFDDVIQSGWFRIVWGRLSMPSMAAQRGRALSAETAGALVSLMRERFKQTFHFGEAARNRSDLSAAVAAIGRGDYEPRNLACQSPEWVAARLWDRPLKDAADRDAALRTWIDRWDLLGAPKLVPAQAWDQDAADAFRDAALKALESDSGLPGWNDFRNYLIREVALSRDAPDSNFEAYFPSVPPTLVERALWLMDPQIERAARDTFDACKDIFGLVRLLLDDIQAESHAPAPHKLAATLFALTLDRPELLLDLMLTMRWRPVLLADLLLYPATAAFACLLVAQWQSQSSAYDREVTRRDDQTTKSIAFADAVSVMGHFLEQGSLPPAEAASLLDWLHKTTPPGFVDELATQGSLLSILRAEIAAQPASVLQAVLAALTAAMPASGLGTSTFAAALDLVDAGGLAGEIEPTPLIAAYADSFSAVAHFLSANRISLGGAAALVGLADRASPDLRRKFLYPLDIKARLAAASAPGENIYTAIDDMASAVRAHIRILSRAAASLAGTLSEDFANALIAAVHAGALRHDEKGRVAAFAPGYEASILRGPEDRPIAADLGAALHALPTETRDRLLEAILETDEPMMLAQLLAFAPGAMREKIKQRIDALTPSEAGDVRSLTDAQARIEALLTAGLADAAAKFIEAERDLKTLGKVAGRDSIRLRDDLRLKLIRGDWTGIEGTQLPTDFPKGEQQSAQETIEFYKALAALTNPSGNREAAEHRFAQLQRRRPDVAAYTINLFAARINLLMAGDLFAQLHGAAIARGRKTLADVEQMMLQVRTVSPSDRKILACNKAVLLLALGQPEQANDLLAVLRDTDDSAAAYAAIALARMGRNAEAAAVLNHAEQTIGRSDVLHAARAQIQSGQSFAGAASTSSEGDSVQRVKAALFDLRQMDPEQQATVLRPQPGNLSDFVTGQVRSAAASVLALVPMIDKENKLSEDDVSAFMREFLTPRFDMLGWSVPDQSKSGFTAKENPGESDILLKKDSTVLAVIEAVVCERPVTHEWARSELTSHFQKLLAYSACALFFHLTYSYVDNPASVLNYLKHSAEHDAPAGFSYRQRKDIPHTDAGPVGFIARYAAQFGDIDIVFLVLDMKQQPQRDAAKTAAGSNPRNKKKPAASC
jgi:hypothetical protein